MDAAQKSPVKETEARAQVFDLIMGCPYGSYDRCCPLFEVSKLNLVQKWEWIRNQSSEQIAKHLDFHRECVESFNAIPIKAENVENH